MICSSPPFPKTCCERSELRCLPLASSWRSYPPLAFASVVGARYGEAWITPRSISLIKYLRKRSGCKHLRNLGVAGKNLDGTGNKRVRAGKKRFDFLPLPANVSTETGKKEGKKMDDSGNNPRAPAVVGRSKRGFKRYETNPSVPPAGGLATRSKRVEVPGGKAAVIIDHSSGEIRGIGGMGFWWNEEVGKGRFVKLFLEGIKQAAGLSKAGMLVFAVVYSQMRENPGKDQIALNYYLARKYGLDMPERTFRHGLRQLLAKEFIFESMVSDVFFVNIRYMFNGDRLAFVRTYHVKRTEEQEIPLPQPALALPAPDQASGAGVPPVDS